LWGNYNGTPSSTVTPLEGIRAAVSLATKVTYAQGCGVTSRDQSGFDEAVELALKADIAVMILGLSQAIEGEENQEEGVEEGEKSTGDRAGLDLPGVQEELLKAIHATGVPIVLVLINGSAISINWADEHVDAILEAWYPGQAGGTAIAEVLFGDYNPAGRLPVTFYKSVNQLPPFRDYDMAGRTYRYITEEPLYPFGHGLSYTQFEYSNLQIMPQQVETNGIADIRVDVINVGDTAGDEIIQLYIHDPQSDVVRPRQELKGFTRIFLQPGQYRTVHFQLAASQMSFFENGVHWLEPGIIEVMIGASSADVRLRGEFEIVGERADVGAERVFFTDVLIE
jgi:beta-glucosidase